jgi:murein L,D-transpeptidase YcbB/YkuD
MPDARKAGAGVCRATIVAISALAFSGFAGPAVADRGDWDFESIARPGFASEPAPPTRTELVVGEQSPMLSLQSERLLQDAIGRYQKIVEAGGWPEVPHTRTLMLWSTGKAVSALRRRLVIEGYLPAAAGEGDTYDETVEEAVRHFQLNQGLFANGRVEATTLAALNVPATARLATLKANLPRVTQYAKGLGSRYVVVNIPAAQLESVEKGRVHSRHNVIAGKIDRPSPVVESKITEINFNPYWNAPVSIVERDIIPQVQKNPKILSQLKIKIYDGLNGPEVDPKTIDWSKVQPDRYHFRQEPGNDNAMASVKISFPNPYAVYMHDTPTKQLFTQSARYFSSGCVRVDKVHLLTDWILAGQDGWNQAKIAAITESKDRLDVKVADPPQLRFAYLTGWVTADGEAHFRPDVYDLDNSGFVDGQPEAKVAQGGQG